MRVHSALCISATERTVVCPDASSPQVCLLPSRVSAPAPCASASQSGCHHPVERRWGAPSPASSNPPGPGWLGVRPFLSCGVGESRILCFHFLLCEWDGDVHPGHYWAQMASLFSDAEVSEAQLLWWGGQAIRPSELSLGRAPEDESGQGAVAQGRQPLEGNLLSSW